MKEMKWNDMKYNLKQNPVRREISPQRQKQTDRRILSSKLLLKSQTTTRNKHPRMFLRKFSQKSSWQEPNSRGWKIFPESGRQQQRINFFKSSKGTSLERQLPGRADSCWKTIPQRTKTIQFFSVINLQCMRWRL